MNEKIKELFSNQEFVEKMFSLETAEEVQALLAENDVDFSLEEIYKLHEELAKMVQTAENGEAEEMEIEDEALEDVSGGMGLVIAAIGALIFASIGLPAISLATRNRW